MTTATLFGYEMDTNEYGEMTIDAPCGCPACDDGVQPGHFACSQAQPTLVLVEKSGDVIRYFNGTSWVWAVGQGRNVRG